MERNMIEVARGAPTPPDPITHTTLGVCILVLILITWLIFGHKIQGMFAWSKWISEGSMACLMGLAAGLALLVWDRATGQNQISKSLSFDPAIFFTYMLPPIIFYGGLAIERKLFVSNLLSIMSFGVFGTFVSFTVLAVVLYWISQLPNVLRFSDCLALAAIFAATDSVAVLQVLRPESHPALYSILLGEGVMNDATSVALLNTVRLLKNDATFSATTCAYILVFFLYMFIASCALGLGAGLGIAMVMKRLGPFSEPQEVGLVGALAYTSYLLAELLGLSGILTLFFCGMAVSHYALQHVSKSSRASLLSAFRTLSYLLEGIILLYVGRDALDPHKWANARFLETVYLVVFILVLVAGTRALFVFPLTWLHNRWSTQTLYLGDGVAIWWAGMMRGAVSVAMVYYSFDPRNVRKDSHSATIVVTTLQIVLFSTVVLGGLTGPLLKVVLTHSIKPPNPNGLRGFASGSCSTLVRSPRSQQNLRRHLGSESPEVWGGDGNSGWSDTLRTPFGAQATPDAEDDTTASKPNNIEMSAATQVDSSKHAFVCFADEARAGHTREADDRRCLLPSTSGQLPKARAGSKLEDQSLLHPSASVPAMPTPWKAAVSRPPGSGTPGSSQGRQKSDGLRSSHDRDGTGSQQLAASLPVSSDTQQVGADWEQQLLHGDEDAQTSPRQEGAMPQIFQRGLVAAQGWADRNDWERRWIGTADGGLGATMYSRFKQFDAKYMQPLFGADDRAGSSHSVLVLDGVADGPRADVTAPSDFGAASTTHEGVDTELRRPVN